MTRKITVDIVLFLYIFLFVYASVTKLADYHKFLIQLAQSPILTDHAVFLSWAVPFSELFIVSLLMVPRMRLCGLYAAFSLMVLFTTYIILASRFSSFVPCSCGGVIENLTWTEHFIFNMIFALLALTAILLYEETPYRRDQFLNRHLHDREFSAGTRRNEH